MTDNDDNVPTLVMFGCAAVVTVLAVVADVALVTTPLTLAPATALAVVAKATAPDTLAPATAFAVAANVTSPLTLAPATAFAVVANVAKVAVGTAPVIFAPGILVNPSPRPMNVPLPPAIVMLPAFVIRSLLVFKFPLNINELKVPTDVMFGCAIVVRLPPNIPADTPPAAIIEPGVFKLPVVLLNVNPVLPA